RRFHRAAPPRPPLEPGPPLDAAGVDPRRIEAAGAVADGRVAHPLFTLEYVREVARPALARGAERAGRAEAPPIAGYLTCCVGEDRAEARSAAAAIIAFNSTVKTYRAVHTVSGFEREAEAIRAACGAGDFGGM